MSFGNNQSITLTIIINAVVAIGNAVVTVAMVIIAIGHIVVMIGDAAQMDGIAIVTAVADGTTIGEHLCSLVLPRLLMLPQPKH